MKRKPIYEYSDKRASVKYAEEQKQRQKVRDEVSKLMGNNYFTNNKEVIDEPRINNWEGNTN